MSRFNLLLTVAFLALSGGAALGQQSASVMATNQSGASVRAYWTPARLAAAKPLELNAPLQSTSQAASAAPAGPQVSAAGAPPTSKGGTVDEFLFNAGQAAPERGGDDSTPLATSSTGAFFTTSRVFPDAATTAYPFRAAGKLFFHDSRAGGDFICSGSVLDNRIVVTAGHCLWHGDPVAANRYAYTQFLFVPAFRQLPNANAVAPFCSWSASALIVAPEWRNGNGGVPNAQDVSMLEIKDRTGNAGSTLQKIGNVTGFYGFATNSLFPQSITQIGYPKNLDGGLRMEVTWAQSFKQNAPNTVVIGSAQRGGASGGPWLKDFGVAPVDFAAHPAVSRNQVVSVTSYGPTPETPQYLGGSILNSSFLNIYNTICAHQAGNC